MRIGRGLADAILLQVGWWIAVLGAAADRPWVGPAAIAVLMCAHCALRPPSGRKALLGRGLVLAVLGTGLDSLLARTGVLGFSGSPIPGLAPPWITALWFQFAVAPELLESLRTRPALAAAAGALGGPLAYAGGARLGAAVLGPGLGATAALAVLGLVWGVVFPLLLKLPGSLPSTSPEVRPA